MVCRFTHKAVVLAWHQLPSFWDARAATTSPCRAFENKPSLSLSSTTFGNNSSRARLGNVRYPENWNFCLIVVGWYLRGDDLPRWPFCRKADASALQVRRKNAARTPQHQHEFTASQSSELRSTLLHLLGVSATSLKFAADFAHHIPAFASGIRTPSQNCRTDFRLIPPRHRRQARQNLKNAAANLTTTPQIFGRFNSASDYRLHRKCTASAFQMSSK